MVKTHVNTVILAGAKHMIQWGKYVLFLNGGDQKSSEENLKAVE